MCKPTCNWGASRCYLLSNSIPGSGSCCCRTMAKSSVGFWAEKESQNVLRVDWTTGALISFHQHVIVYVIPSRSSRMNTTAATLGGAPGSNVWNCVSPIIIIYHLYHWIGCTTHRTWVPGQVLFTQGGALKDVNPWQHLNVLGPRLVTRLENGWEDAGIPRWEFPIFR